MAAAARAFPIVSASRRALIGKIKVAQKEMALDDATYRSVLFRVTGRASCTDCTDSQLVAVIEEFKRLGWQAKPKKAQRKQADHPTARKARALWISLYQLGAINNASEAALEAFAKRQLGVERMQWADQSLMYKVIEGLNAMAQRNGWNAKQSSVKATKIALLEAILIKLKAKGYAGADWDLESAASRIAEYDFKFPAATGFWEMGDIDAIADKFGRLLRTGRKDGL
jgi:phage gp16-like protein